MQEKLVSYGLEIIPILENYWSSSPNHEVQERVEGMIHKLQFSEVRKAFELWCLEPYDLMQAAILLSRIKFPDLNEKSVWSQFEKIRRNIWLELNSYLTPIEQINVINSILFNYFGYKNSEKQDDENGYYVSFALDNKKGNIIGLGILYLALCKKLDVPVYFIEIPHHFILGYCQVSPIPHDESKDSEEELKFFVNPGSGQLYSLRDLEMYYQKLGEPFSYKELYCADNIYTIRKVLRELKKYYEEAGDKKVEDVNELLEIIALHI